MGETPLPSPAVGGSWTAGGSESAELPAWLEVGELRRWQGGRREGTCQGPSSREPASPGLPCSVWPGLLLGAGRRGTWGVPHPGDICGLPDLSGGAFAHPGWVELGVGLVPRAPRDAAEAITVIAAQESKGEGRRERAALTRIAFHRTQVHVHHGRAGVALLVFSGHVS